MTFAPVTLKGDAVVLQPLARAHAPELAPAALADPASWAFMLTRVKTEDELAAWVDARVQAMEGGTALAFLQRDAATGAAVGSTSLFDYVAAHRRAEIGHTWIAASHRRTALNTDAKLLLFRHAFETLDLWRVQLKTDAENDRSARAIARLGATREGVLRGLAIQDDGEPRDRIMFSVLAPEWPMVEERLRGLLQRT